MTHPPFAHWLPYWTVRDVSSADSTTSVLVLVDGTLVVGFVSSGADVFSADNAQLNRNAAALRRALNALPADAFLQTEWHTGLSSEDLITAYELRAASTKKRNTRPAVLEEQRRWRARMLRTDPSLRRGRLVVFVGQRRALGPLASNAGSGLFSSLGALLGSRRSREPIDPALFSAAVERLRDTAARLRDELSSFGSTLSPMNASALLTEVHRALNPTTSKRVPVVVTDPAAQVSDVSDVSSDAAAYAIQRPLSLREQLPLGDLVWSEGHFTLDDPPVLARALSLQRLPAFTRPDLLMGIQFATDATFRLVSTFTATDREKLTERIIRRRNIAHAQAVGIVRDIAADVAFSEYERVLEKLLTEDQRVFEASVTAIVHASSHAVLDRCTRALKDAFADAGAVLTSETGRQLPSFLGSLPGNGFASPQRHQLITHNAADFVPSFVPSLGDEEAQLLYHTRQGTLRKLSLLPSKLRANNNALVFGSSGSGKSFNVACIFEQGCLAEGAPLLVVDVQGPELSSYRVLAELFGGSYTALASDAEASFSPFAPHDELFGAPSVGKAGEAIDEDALRFMTALVCVMAVPELSVRREKPFAFEIARTAILGAYRATRSAGRAPILGDVVAELARSAFEHHEHKTVAREMYLQLQAWVNDPVRARLLNRPVRRPDSGAGRGRVMQVYDFFRMERDAELATVLLMSVSFAIWQSLRSYPRDVQKLVVFDECWKLLTNETASDIVAELFRTGRKWGASTWAITQNVADFQSSPIHKAVLNNASMMFLMQHAGDHQSVSELCNLNDREASLFRQLRMKKGEYSETLFVERGGASPSGGSASILRLVPTAFDLWLNTTDPNDVGFRSRVMKERALSLLEAVSFCAARFPAGAPAPHGMDERRAP